MWRGIIKINNVEVNLTASATQTGFRKEWSGCGRIIGDEMLNPDIYETELGEIIINKIDYLTGDFTFIGSGKPLINL